MEQLLHQTVIPEVNRNQNNITTQDEVVRENTQYTSSEEDSEEEENSVAKNKVDKLPEDEDQAELYVQLEEDYYETPKQLSEDSEDSDLLSIKKNNSNWKKQREHISIDTELDEVSDHQDLLSRQKSDKVPDTINGSPKRKNRSQSTTNKQQKRAASGSTRGGKKW